MPRLIFLSNCFTFLSMHLHHYGKQGPAVVLIHGIPGSSRAWTGVAKGLADGHRVLVPDLLGFGTCHSAGDLNAEAQARALAGSLDQEGIEKATIVGHDFGGPIAMTLYSSRPDLFEAFGLLATNAFPDTPIPFPLSTVNWPLLGNSMARLVFSTPALKIMLRMYGSNELGNPISVRAIFTDALQNLPERYGHYPAVLASVSVPSLVMWGDRDPFFPVEQGRRVADLLGDVEFTVVKRAGHFLPEQNPTDVAAAIAALVVRLHTHAQDPQR